VNNLRRWLAVVPRRWSMTDRRSSVALVLTIGLLFRMLVAGLLMPGLDEAYYYLYTLNPAWSYFDHPPLVALTTGLGLALNGGEVSPFSIRFGSLLLYTVTLVLLYLAGKQLFSARVGLLALILASITPIFQIAFGLMTLPDAPLMVFWMATVWVAGLEFFPAGGDAPKKLGRSDDPPSYRPTYRLALLGLLVGLACLGKYHGFFLGAGLVLFCLTSPRHRRALVSPWALVALGLFGLTLTPLLYWNASHDWASFTFQAERSVPNRQFSVGQLLGALAVEWGYLFPTIGIPLWWVSLKALVAQIRSPLIRHLSDRGDDQMAQQRLILCVSLPVFFGFTLIGGYRQVLPTWAMPGAFSAILLLAWQADRWSPRGVRRWLTGTAIVVGTVLLIALSHVSFGTLQTPSNTALLGGFIPAQNDASVQLIDVEQMRLEVARSAPLMNALQQSDFLFSNRFHLAGHIAMALHPLNPLPITCFDQRDMRGFAFWSAATDWVGQNGLYITSNEFQTGQDSAAEYQPYFQTWTKIGEIPLRRGGVIVDKFHVYAGTRLLRPFPRPERATRGA
jgi:4-amino-4-deoxy-L-arabinose transferase-like glycosyltransferase